MSQPCPNCGSDLRGEPIPDKHFVHDRESETHKKSVESHQKYNLSGECTCLPYGDLPLEERFYSRMIGREVRGVYDGILIWHCPDCGHNWPRFKADSPQGFNRLHDTAVEIINRWAEQDARATTSGVS